MVVITVAPMTKPPNVFLSSATSFQRIMPLLLVCRLSCLTACAMRNGSSLAKPKMVAGQAMVSTGAGSIPYGNESFSVLAA